MPSAFSDLNWSRITTGVIGILVGGCAAISLLVFLSTEAAELGATIATTLAVIVALFVGLVPWFIAREETRTKSAVTASRILHELQKSLSSAGTIRDGVGFAAETADVRTIQRAAKRCCPQAPETLDEKFDNLAALPYEDALAVSSAVMAAIDLYVGVWSLANLDIEESLEPLRMLVVKENGGIAPPDIESRAEVYLGRQMQQIARAAAHRAMDAQERIPRGLEALRRHGAVGPKLWTNYASSPVPEVHEAVQAGLWPPK